MKRTNLFGISALMVIMISCVCIAQPNMTATESLIQNAGVISTESAGMNALDVIHEVDGTEVAGKLTAFDGEKFTLEIEGEIKEISRADVVYISLGRQQPRPKLLYVGSDTDDLANAAVAETLEKAGFDLTAATRLPASLEGFDVVVLESVSASSSDAANMLRSFVGKGGGAVLIGSVPKSLCPEGKRNYYWNDDMNMYFYPWDTSAIADWFGAATMESARISNPRVAASFANPFLACPDIMVGQELYVFQGECDSYYFVTGSLSAQARPVAKIRFESNGFESTNIAAFAHPFGTGRTYYQFMSYEPNHPKLLELLVAATKWTAGVLPEIGG